MTNDTSHQPSRLWCQSSGTTSGDLLDALESLAGVIVTDLLDGVSDNSLEVELGLGGDFC